MLNRDQWWEAIQAGVYMLPHRVEWHEQEQLMTDTQRIFIVPKDVVQLFGPNYLEQFRDLAFRKNCRLISANNGSMIFQKLA